jgi:zinc transporter ZupT
MTALANVSAFTLGPTIGLLTSAYFTWMLSISSPKIKECLQPFASSVVLSAVAAELVPEMKKPEAPAWAMTLVPMISAASGLLCVRMYMNQEEEDYDPYSTTLLKPRFAMFEVRKDGRISRIGDGGVGIPWAGIIASMLDLICDGWLVGVSWATGPSACIVLACCVTLEMISLGAATAMALRERRVKALAAVCVVAFLAACLQVSAEITYYYAAPMRGTSAFFRILASGITACLWRRIFQWRPAGLRKLLTTSLQLVYPHDKLQ